MAAQIAQPGIYGGAPNATTASFLYHLGDISYKDEDPSNPAAKDQATIYNAQFYAQYAGYQRDIFAIPGTMTVKLPVMITNLRSFTLCRISAIHIAA